MRKLDREENPLYKFRKKKRWTRVELSRKSGLGYAVLDYLETGILKRVSPRVMARLLPLGLPEDLPEQFKRWKAEMEQRALAAQDEEGDAVNVEMEETPVASPAVESPDKPEGPAEASLDEPALGETI
jgi:transcriptional regulator with XRE-family HTH domain